MMKNFAVKLAILIKNHYDLYPNVSKNASEIATEISKSLDQVASGKNSLDKLIKSIKESKLNEVTIAGGFMTIKPSGANIDSWTGNSIKESAIKIGDMVTVPHIEKLDAASSFSIYRKTRR